MKRALSNLRFAVAAVAAASLLLLAGHASAQQKLRVGKAQADAFSFLPVEIGIEHGFFKKYGVEVESSGFAGDAKLQQAIAADAVDIAIGSGPAMAFVAKGNPELGVAAMANQPLLLDLSVQKDGPIKTAADLKGHTVAISSPGSLPDLLVKGMLQAKKVPANEVKFAPQGADLDRYKSLIAGITDAAVVSNEFVPVMPKNVHVLMTASEVVPQFMRLCIATSSKAIKSKRDDLVKFVAAEMEAYRFAETHPDEAIKLAHEMTHTKPDDKRAGFIVHQAIEHKQLDPSLAIPQDRIQWMEDLFKTAGVIPKTLPVSELVDKSVRDDAAKQAGKK